jgi:hypothetical protein
VAFHVYRQIAEGPGGGDLLKASVRRPEVRDLVSRIGGVLAWHGALSFDHILDSKTNSSLVFDANPRLVEPMNAWLSGVDLTGALLSVSRGEAPPVQPDGRKGVVTKIGLMGLLDAARRRGRRRDILGELALLASGLGRYRGAVEELLPLTAPRRSPSSSQNWSCPRIPLPICRAARSAATASRRTPSRGLEPGSNGQKGSNVWRATEWGECARSGHSLTASRMGQVAAEAVSSAARRKRAVQHQCDGFDPAVRVLRESVPGHPILGHKQKWVAESRIFSADKAAGSMPRDTAGLELWVRNQSDFAGFRWC